MAGPGGSQKTIFSSVAFQDPQGVVLANGVLILDLNSPGIIASSGGQIVPTTVAIPLTSAGQIPANTLLYCNDQIQPGGTVYKMRLFNGNGLLVSGPNYWSIAGTSPIDLSQEIPVSTFALSFAAQVIGLTSQIFTSNGTFTIPSAKVKVFCVGGGGAGGGSNGINSGLGGGGGGISIKWLSGLTIGNNLTVTIGLAGSGVSAANGQAGGASQVSSGTQLITTIIANGGSGGAANVSGTTGLGGAGGAPGAGGDLNFAGMPAPNFTSTAQGNAGGGSPLCGGGQGQGFVAGNGVAAQPNNFGAGGSGSQGTGPFAGGNGANGVIIFEWTN